MFVTVKEKIPFLKDKTLDEYNQTIMMPSFNIMELYSNAIHVGVDVNYYKNIIKSSKNVHSLEQNYRIMKLINYINKVVFDQDFVNKVVKKIIFVVNYGTFECHNKSFAGMVKHKDNEYKLALEIDTNSITFASEYGDSQFHGKFSIEPDGIKIKYNETRKRLTDYSNKILYDIKNSVNIENYTQRGIQTFGYSKVQKYKYYEDKQTKEKKIKEITPEQNFTKQEYVWKCPQNTIIKRREIKYKYPKNEVNNISNIDEYLIGKNISPNNTKLPSKGNFIHLDKALFWDYFSNKYDINTLWENVDSYTMVK